MKDLPVLQSLNQQLFHHDYQFDKTLNLTWPSKNKDYYKKRIQEKNAIVLIAEEDNSPVAYLIGAIEKAAPYRAIKTIAEIENMFVIEGKRGKGIGSALMQTFLTWAKKKGSTRAKILVSAQNDQAQAVYVNNGFSHHEMVMERVL